MGGRLEPAVDPGGLRLGSFRAAKSRSAADYSSVRLAVHVLTTTLAVRLLGPAPTPHVLPLSRITSALTRASSLASLTSGQRSTSGEWKRGDRSGGVPTSCCVLSAAGGRGPHGGRTQLAVEHRLELGCHGWLPDCSRNPSKQTGRPSHRGAGCSARRVKPPEAVCLMLRPQPARSGRTGRARSARLPSALRTGAPACGARWHR